MCVCVRAPVSVLPTHQPLDHRGIMGTLSPEAQLSPISTVNVCYNILKIRHAVKINPFMITCFLRMTESSWCIDVCVCLCTGWKPTYLPAYR